MDFAIVFFFHAEYGIRDLVRSRGLGDVYKRQVEATVKLATAAPEGVNLSSGSSVRLPMTVMTVSPAMVRSLSRVGCLR